jgi:hypothetical protein
MELMTFVPFPVIRISSPQFSPKDSFRQQIGLKIKEEIGAVDPVAQSV